MDLDRFWQIVADACEADLHWEAEWDQRLKIELMKLPSDAIIDWNQIFDRMAAQAYTKDLWGAAYTINGGASDDGFHYFRCWLICMGREVYEAAIANPDSLADVVIPGVDAEAETYWVAHQAWMEVTGQPDTAPYPARDETAELVGEAWNYRDRAELTRRLPRLAALYHEDD